jgi:hypothetical protein
MMRLPALLAVKLMKSRIARVFNARAADTLIHCVDPAEILHSGSAAPVSKEKMQGILESLAPFIWIGGSEPLDHPGIAHFVRAIAQSGHYAFLETNGILLRRRIHEFQPLSQLFLTIRLDTLQMPESDLVVEGLRAARLSGFFRLVHSIVSESSDLASLKALSSFIGKCDLDGWVITAGSADQATAAKAAKARSLIPSAFWRRFSGLVERELLMQAKGRELRDNALADKSQAETCQESARVA